MELTEEMTGAASLWIEPVFKTGEAVASTGSSDKPIAAFMIAEVARISSRKESESRQDDVMRSGRE